MIDLRFDSAALITGQGRRSEIVDETGMGPLYAVANMNTLIWVQGRPAHALESNAEYDAAGLMTKLIDKGANVNAQLKKPILKRHHYFLADRQMIEGATPLMRAAKYGDVKLAKILLDPARVTQDLKTKDGNNALTIAAGVEFALRFRRRSASPASLRGRVESRSSDAARRGIDINYANDQGMTALHGAVQRGQGAGNGNGEKEIRLLAERGAKLDIKDKKGRTPLDMAVAGEGQILNRVNDSGPLQVAGKLFADAGLPVGEGGAAKPADKPGQKTGLSTNSR